MKRVDASGNIWQITEMGNLYLAVMTCPPSDSGLGYTQAWWGHEDKAVVEAQLDDYFTVLEARSKGCNRICGNIPNGPICTKCNINLHAGKWGNGERDLHFGYGQNWREVLEQMSVVKGWIKPGGKA